MADGFGDLNAVGEARDTGRSMGGDYGGNDGRGPIDNVLPTGIVARGEEVTARGDMSKGVRKDMSVQRNSSKARGMSDRK